MKEIPLTQGKIALIDDEDYELISKFKWHAKKDGRNWYAMTDLYINGRRTCSYMHIMVTNKKRMDHIDGNGLNNQKLNLRSATRNQNQGNRRKTLKQVTSKYKGVSWSKRHNKWMARVGRKQIGVYSDETEAARAYNKAAIQYFGEFAKLNEI